MRGSIVRRGEKFHAARPAPGADGKRKQKWLSGYPTRREAEAALAHALNEVHTGGYVEPTAMTVRQYLCDELLPASAARVRATTLRGYRQLIDSYAVPALGDVPLADVTPVVLTKLYGRLLTSGRANGKDGLSARTVRFLHTVLRRPLSERYRAARKSGQVLSGRTPGAVGLCTGCHVWVAEDAVSSHCCPCNDCSRDVVRLVTPARRPGIELLPRPCGVATVLMNRHDHVVSEPVPCHRFFDQRTHVNHADDRTDSTSRLAPS